MQSLFDTIWGICYGPNRTLNHSSPWEPIRIWSAFSNRHCDQFSQTHQNQWQKVKNCRKKICTMLANGLSLASALHTWSRYRIHRTRNPNAVTKLSHQICVHYCKKSTVQCCVWKNAPNSGKYPKEKIYVDILPNIWGHIASTKYMYNIHGDRLPIQNICTTYMGTDC